jgi:hypothetical protein
MRCSSFEKSASRRSARGEARHSNFSSRVVKRCGNIPASKPADQNHIDTEPNYLPSLASENGVGAKSKMGKG